MNVLRGIKFLDDRAANPAYGGLLVVGILLLLPGPYKFTTLWVAVAVGLYVVMGAVALRFYSPTLTRQIGAYEAGGAQSTEFGELAARGRLLVGIPGVLVLAIIVLMVVKPGV